MNRILYCLFYLSGLFLFPPAAGAQCGYTATIAGNRGLCVGNLLHISSTHAFSKIVWYKDGAPVKTANATQSLNTNGVVFAALPGQGGIDTGVSNPGSLAFDSDGNLYVCELGSCVKKYPPGGGVGVVVAGVDGQGSGASQLNQPRTLFIDRQNNLYVLDCGNDRIQKFAPGETVGTTAAVLYAGSTMTSFYVDCMGNIYVSDDLYGSVDKFTTGSTKPTVVAGDHTGNAANQLYWPGLVSVDSAGNIFVVVGDVASVLGNPSVLEYTPGSTTGIVVAGGHGFGYAHNQISYLAWMDGQDNMYVADYSTENGNGKMRIDIWPLGASSGTTILEYDGYGSMLGQYNLGLNGFAEDLRGNICISDFTLGRILKYQRTVDIDTLYTPTDPGQYYAVVTDIQGYTETTPAIAVITPDPVPASITISATAISAAVCVPITFTATAAHAGPSPDFQWEVSGVKVGKDSNSYSNNLFADGDQVFCVLTSPYACSLGPGGDTSNIITLSIDAHGTATVAIAASDTAVCTGSPVTFAATVTNGATQPTFQWLLNGNPVPGDDTTAYHTDSLADNDVITCVITSDNACGLAKSNSIHMFVSVPPSIAAGQIFTIKYGDSLTLNPEISGNIISFNWTPATGLSDSTIANPVAAPRTTTDYKLKIVSAGCGADSGYILVNVYTPLAFPNAFTPNGDGHNDDFYVLSGPVNSLVEDFAVFNRYGAEVFHVHDVAPGDRAHAWNGTFHGTPAPAGTYVYVVTMKLAGGNRQVYKGTVMLIR